MSRAPTPIPGPAPVIFDARRREALRRAPGGRRLVNRLFLAVCIGTATLSVVVLAVLLGAILWAGVSGLDWAFLTSPPDTDPERAGIHPSLWGTVWVCSVCAVAALPLGVAAALFIEEFQPRRRWLRRIHGFIQLNISNLAGVPSVVYGIIGLTAFAHMFALLGTPNDPAVEWGVTWYDQYFNEAWQVVLVPAESGTGESAPVRDGMPALRMVTPEVPEGIDPAQVDPVARPVELNLIASDAPFPEDPDLAARSIRAGSEPGRISLKSWYYFRLPFGRGVLTGGLTLMLVILPVVIIATQESLRAVPGSLREGALGMGATPWQVVRQVTLPAALPGIMTGSIIAMSRAIGEAAPLLMIAGIVFIVNPPGHVMDDFTAMPLQIFNWAQRPQEAFHELAASGIIVLLAVLLAFNAVAVVIRQKLQKPLS